MFIVGLPFMITQERIHGCLLGGALGDALGYPLEFIKPSSTIVQHFGQSPPVEIPTTSDSNGIAVVSDDTQMTLFTAEALLRAKSAGSDAWSLYALGAYQRWHSTQSLKRSATWKPPQGQGLLLADPRMHVRRAPGNTCLGALARSFMVQQIGTISDPPNNSKGCGAVMRSAPFGIAATTRHQAFQGACEAAVLTHGHPSGYLSAGYFAALIFDLLRGVPLLQAMTFADKILGSYEETEELADTIESARSISSEREFLSAEQVEQLGGGWVGEQALAIGIASSLCVKEASPKAVAHALWSAVAHSGDSDSTGAITGNLLGALWGKDSLPTPWLAHLELRDLIEKIANDLFDTMVGNKVPDPQDYPAHDGRFVRPLVAKSLIKLNWFTKVGTRIGICFADIIPNILRRDHHCWLLKCVSCSIPVIPFSWGTAVGVEQRF
jgi:ADP-ribosylglycohydrolase